MYGSLPKIGIYTLIKGIWGVEKMLELLLVPAAGLTVASENRSEKIIG